MALATHDTWRFRVPDLWRMKQAGVLPADARVELLDGEVVPMSPEGSEHGSLIVRLHHKLLDQVGARASLWSQSPLRLDEHTLVQPDLALLRPRKDGYFHKLPSADDVLLTIEVSHSSAARDRLVKAPLYARSGVPELWLVRVADRTIEALRSPSAEGYRTRAVVRGGEHMAMATLEGVSVAPGDLFPAR